MKRTPKQNLLAIAVVLAGTATVSQAQITIISDNLDSHSGATAGYSFGDATNFSHTYVSGVGVGGSVGAQVLSDFSPPGVGYGGVAFQYQNGNVSGNTSPNLSDYTLSFDALVNKANGGFELVVQAWSGQYFSGTLSQGSTASDIRLATPNVFQHYDINLGTLSSGLVPTGATLQIAWQMDEFTYGGPGTGNELVIDNVQLTMAVPEPSSMALGALGLAAFALRLRRNR
jgi:hypothetical protein